MSIFKNKDQNTYLTESEGMSAMTDVVFLLLIFFIVTMSSYVEMTLLEVKLPTSSSTGESVSPDLSNIIKIELAENADGSSDVYLVNGITLDLNGLRVMLDRYARLMPTAEFLIRCHPESKHAALTTILSETSLRDLKNIKMIKY